MQNMKQKEQNLILGSIINLEINEISPFLISLQKTDFCGTIVFFVSMLKKETHDYLLKMGVKVIDFNYKEVNDIISIHAFRYFLYKKYLDVNEFKYNNIMLTDTRDVIFQKNPFDFPIGDRLNVFLEDNKIQIGNCIFNSNWILERFGEEQLKKLHGCAVSCSGITFGNTSSILQYLTLMTKFLLPPLKTIGYDQGIHNYLIHNDYLINIKIFENEVGPVLTMGNVAVNEFQFNADGFLINRTCDVVNTLHQYDRHKSIIGKLSAIRE